MSFPILKGVLAAVSIAALSAGAALADSAPGTAPEGKSGATVQRDAGILAASGLKVFYRKFGKYRVSVDAAGSNNVSHTVSVNKPSATAVVDKAYLMAASWGNTAIANGDILLQNQPVTWIDGVFNDVPPSLPNYFHSVLADVTSIVKPRLDARTSAGIVNLSLREVNKNGNIDGETLVVVFRLTSTTAQNRSIILMFGGQQLAGDRFEITLSEPIDPREAGARADMGLGVSFGFQGNFQYSIIDVNGRRLSTAAGGQDDGADFNGALITAGGIGDSRSNPADPNAIPTGPRSDDELYSLLPYIEPTQRTIRVDTRNPSNDDNIFFAWFDLSERGDVNKDTDGDGLLDSWERNGYDHDGNGTIDVPIHRRGANYRKKNIFIAYAYMRASATEAKSHQPSSTVLNAVKAAFARAPVGNPDGTTGINLIFSNRGGVAHDDDLNPVWTEFDAIMNPLVSEAERRIYHRMLSGHGYSGTGSSGLSRGIPASDFIETLGLFPSNPGTFRERAGTIMHELGHNLGLRHGGVDHENYKPNHLSIMSYHNQLDWLRKNGSPFLDYERFDLRDLNEAALSEAAGLNRVGGDAPIAVYGVRWFSGGIARQKNTGANANVNWNAAGAANEPNVAVDLNNADGQTVLRARFNEWANIAYDGGDIGAGLGPEKNLMTSPDDLRELTYEDYLEMKSKMLEVK